LPDNVEITSAWTQHLNSQRTSVGCTRVRGSATARMRTS
jgi:hypothetical protein